MEYKNDALCLDKINVSDNETYSIDNQEWMDLVLDSSNHILEGFNTKGEKIFGKIPPQLKNIHNLGSRVVIAASDSIHKEYADYVCTGEHDQDLINFCINLQNVSSIYLLDGTYIISAPIIPKSNFSIEGHPGCVLTTIDMVYKHLVESVSSGNVFHLDSVDGLHIGMLLYIAVHNDPYFDSRNSWGRSPKIIAIDSSANTITLSRNIYREWPVDTEVKSASPCILIENKSNIVISNLTIEWNVENNPRQKYNPWYLQEGVQIAFSENVVVKECKINNGGRRGICATNSKYFWILNNYFDNWDEHSIDIFVENGFPYDSSANLDPMINYGIISGNICENNDMCGIQCHRGSGCSIYGNTINNCKTAGIRNQEFARNNSISGNVINHCGYGLLIGGHDTVATGNTILDCSIGICIGDFSDRIQVIGNSLYNSCQTSINFLSSCNCVVSNNIITNSCLSYNGWSDTDIDNSIICFSERTGTVYDRENTHNIVKGNTIIEYNREIFPKHIYKNTELQKHNYFVDNICIIEGDIDVPFVYDSSSDVIKNNDIIK